MSCLNWAEFLGWPTLMTVAISVVMFEVLHGSKCEANLHCCLQYLKVPRIIRDPSALGSRYCPRAAQHAPGSGSVGGGGVDSADSPGKLIDRPNLGGIRFQRHRRHWRDINFGLSAKISLHSLKC
jgi:hypothetical protein